MAFRVAIAFAATLVWYSGSALADDRPGSAFMRIYGTAPPPYGYVEYCRSNQSACRPGRPAARRFSATPDRLAELDRVNRQINRTIEPATDEEIFGVKEYWTMPRTRGDCEDYVLLKRQVLIRRGWPANALLITVVRDEVGDGHAVLTVRTAQGDFILDNKVDEVRVWHETPYRYLMRQSYLNAQVWMALDPAVRASTTTAAANIATTN
ncbi:MAG: transglutaminase-like cysteine peptidase [Pseudomonadota bacterium]